MLGMCGNVADLTISATDSPDPVVIGQQVTYTLQVASSGPDAANAAAGLRLPAGLAFVSATASAGACSPRLPVDRTVRCLLGDLTGTSPGNTATVTIVARAYEGGLKTVTGTAVTSVLDPAPANDVDAETTRVTVPGGADLTISAAPGGGVALSWTGGDAQAGYVIGRIAGGVQTRIPATGHAAPRHDVLRGFDGRRRAGQLLPGGADDGGGHGTRALPDVVRLAGHRVAARGPRRFPAEAMPAEAADLTWSPFGGQTGYVLRLYTATGE